MTLAEHSAAEVAKPDESAGLSETRGPRRTAAGLGGRSVHGNLPGETDRSRVSMGRMPRPTSLAVLLVLGLLVSGCGGTDDDPTVAPTVSATSAAPTAPAQTTEPTAPTTDDALVVSLTVAGGEVSGDTGRVDVPLGSRVRLTVTSDAADEIHVHGFELTEPLTAGQPAQLEFVADRAGIFEVELHDERLVLTRLQVQ